MVNPYETPNTPEVSEETIDLDPKRYGGIGRLVFVGCLLLFLLLQHFGIRRIAPVYLTDGAVTGLGYFLILLFGVAVFFRLKNIGMTTWLAPLIIIPFINLFVAFRCLVFQEGYQDSKKLDHGGRIMKYFILCLFGVLFVIFAVLTVYDVIELIS